MFVKSPRTLNRSARRHCGISAMFVSRKGGKRKIKLDPTVTRRYWNSNIESVELYVVIEDFEVVIVWSGRRRAGAGGGRRGGRGGEWRGTGREAFSRPRTAALALHASHGSGRRRLRTSAITKHWSRSCAFHVSISPNSTGFWLRQGIGYHFTTCSSGVRYIARYPPCSNRAAT